MREVAKIMLGGFNWYLLSCKIDELRKEFTTVVEVAGKKEAVRVALDEGVFSDAYKQIKKWIDGIHKWAASFDKKLNKIKSELGV